jgi:hypothetical protein
MSVAGWTNWFWRAGQGSENPSSLWKSLLYQFNHEVPLCWSVGTKIAANGGLSHFPPFSSYGSKICATFYKTYPTWEVTEDSHIVICNFNYNVQDFLQMTGFFPIAVPLPMPSCSLSACLEQVLICWYGKLNVVMCLWTCKCWCGKATFTCLSQIYQSLGTFQTFSYLLMWVLGC